MNAEDNRRRGVGAAPANQAASEQAGAATTGANSVAGAGAGSASAAAARRPNAAIADLLESQLVKFVLVGGFSAIVDFGSTALFTFAFGLGDGVAKTLGFILGTLTAYFINRRWTFQAEASTKRFVITMLTYLLTYAVQVGLYKLSIPWLEGFELNAFWVRLISFVIAQGTATVLNFVIQKFLIFKN